MLAELVMSYYLTNTEPMYLRTSVCPCADVVVALHVNRSFWRDRMYVDLQPYVMRDMKNEITGRAGAEVELGYRWRDVSLGLYHHSSHDLDFQTGPPVEIDGFRVRVNLLR